MSARRAADIRFLVSGILTLSVAMGVGRFAYTPLLPVMERDAGLTVSLAGALASANLFGYLVGASIVMAPFTHVYRLAIVRYAIASVIVTTGAMAVVSAPALWIALRFITGVSSGLVFIFTVSIVLERAAREGNAAWPPILFSGVGLGIAFSGIAVPLFVAAGGSHAAWLGLATLSAIAIGVSASWITDERPAPAASVAHETGRAAKKSTFPWLIAVYAAEGFAYIIPATFLVAIVSRIPALAQYAAASWIVVGFAGALATGPWIRVGARFGKSRALAVALVVQALGIAAPVVSSGPVAVVFAAVALGGTFIAITLFSSGLGRDMFPNGTSIAISRLTVVYGVGQIVGPIVATNLALRYGSYAPALVAGSVAAALAALGTVLKVRDP